ncbi:hypothetical protein PHYSODRAFT_432380, partial [Phytophthora sojae]
WLNVQMWVEMRVTEAYVKQELGLAGLAGKTLESHPNYKILKNFKYAREGRELDELLEHQASTKFLWEDLRLNEVEPELLKTTDAFKTYVRYANKVDEDIWRFKTGAFHQNHLFEPKVYYGGSPEEMAVKLELWAKAKRPGWYVKKLLYIDALEGTALISHPHYAYYQKFLDLRGK